MPEDNPWSGSPRGRLPRYEMEERERWREVGAKMPELTFQPDWKVQIIPPFAGAVARFMVTNAHGARISVYADWYDALGSVGRPYWEAYIVGEARTLADPEDPERFMINDTAGLLAFIRDAGDPVIAARYALSGRKEV